LLAVVRLKSYILHNYPTRVQKVPVHSPPLCARCSVPLTVKSDSGFCDICLPAADTVCLRPLTFGAKSPKTPAKPPEPKSPDNTNSCSFTAAADAAHIPQSSPYSSGIDLNNGLPLAPPGYELLQRLGSGAMGDVYLAREEASERKIAIKFLRFPSNQTAVERFLTEVRAIARIDHPNIVKVYATDFYCLIPFFTMEFIGGVTLSEWVALNGPQSPTEAAQLTISITRAIKAAHAVNVLHRDLKPSNIIRCENGTLKVVDFGLAKRTDRDDELTLANNPLGTPSFMPPEQISRQYGEIGPPADVYGLGATLYYLLTGIPPFNGLDATEIVGHVITELPTSPRDIRSSIPRELEAIVLKCLEKDPGCRYPTAAALEDDLERFQAGLIPLAPQATPFRRAQRWASRNRKQLLKAVVVVMIAVVAFFIGSVSWPIAMPLATSIQPDPLEEMQQVLDSGHSIELIGGTGWPRWHRLVIGEGSLVHSETKDKTVALQTHDIAYVELIPDPRHDHYQVTADVRYLDGSPVDTCAGIYIGDDEIVSANGTSIHSIVAVGFADIYTLSELSILNVKPVHRVKLWTTTPFERPDQIVDRGRMTEKGNSFFTPCESASNPWRTLLFDVSPEGITSSWVNEDKRQLQVGTISAKALALDRKRVQADLVNTIHDPTPIVPPWHPRRPIGIWAIASVASFRNVKIIPVPVSQ
jgi:eukaryotic-like serine/threonine-protein kinase